MCFVSRLPLVGEIQNRIVVDGADVHDKRIGSSRAMPSVLEIVVDDKAGEPGNVGQIVKRTFFPDEGRFIFNVAFSCGKPPWFGPGVYADPRSIWFNVFFGYYEIDVPCSSWSRPFGYRLENGTPKVDFLDLIRIGKSDWNYFSNYLYGVPKHAIEPHNTIDPSAVTTRYVGRELIGESSWDSVVLDNVEVVSGYVARQGEQLVDNDSFFTPIWRELFGRPRPRKNFTQSFFPTRMRANIYMAFSEGDDSDLGERAYKTLIFGATINKGYDVRDASENERFLGLQVAGVKKVIVGSYGRAGFR